MKKFLLTGILSAACAASMMAQTDVTYKIVNPSFENGTEGWTVDGLVPQTNSSFTKKAGKTYMEKWTGKGGSVGSASIKQSLTNLPKGNYRLTVAAQNIQQDQSAEQTGAVVFGKNTKTNTTVTKAADYTVDFTITVPALASTIGFTATNASGNWICVDNFRLTYLSTTADDVTAHAATAKTQLDKKLNDENRNALTTAIDNAEKAVSDEAADLTGVMMILQDTYIAAQANTKAYSTLSALANSATLLQGKKMSAAADKALADAIEAAQAAQDRTDNDPVKLTEDLQTAYNNAKSSQTAYANFLTSINNAKKYVDETLVGGKEFSELVNAADKAYTDGSASNEEIEESIDALTKGLFAFRLANGTPGDGAAPEAKLARTYVVTGATEAMVRTAYSGDNLIERGVCWSTEHEPTVLDNRTTKSFTLNGTVIHIKDLKPATVYYVRPYALNKTYTVAYGEEVKLVTHPQGTCTGSWDNGAPTEAANTRCRNAINETIEYFNQWTGIKGFNLSGHYGASTPTADCSYGGWMRIGPNAGNQAIGTVIHETGHGVGVGTSARWKDTNVHNWKWYGREANEVYSFLENKDADPYNSEFCMVGDGTHGWGASASYDWFVNGADKDKHLEYQYIGGCALLYGMFIDGLCPTSSYSNGIAGYTYNFDDSKYYYIMNKSDQCGLGDALLSQRLSYASLKNYISTGTEIDETAAWTLEYDPQTSLYSFKNVATGRYLSRASSEAGLKILAKPTATEKFQLMPDRTDVECNGKDGNKITTHGYWLTWNNSGDKAFSANRVNATLGYGKVSTVSFDYADTATKQQWIILSEDEIKQLGLDVPTAIKTIETVDAAQNAEKKQQGIYNANGVRINALQKGLNIIKYTDGSAMKVFKK